MGKEIPMQGKKKVLTTSSLFDKSDPQITEIRTLISGNTTIKQDPALKSHITRSMLHFFLSCHLERNIMSPKQACHFLIANLYPFFCFTTIQYEKSIKVYDLKGKKARIHMQHLIIQRK